MPHVSARWLGCALTLVHGPAAVALNNGLALTPPQAWTSWDLCRFEVNATLIKEVALALNSTGLQATSRQGRWWHLAGISCPHSDF